MGGVDDGELGGEAHGDVMSNQAALGERLGTTQAKCYARRGERKDSQVRGVRWHGWARQCSSQASDSARRMARGGWQ